MKNRYKLLMAVLLGATSSFSVQEKASVYAVIDETSLIEQDIIKVITGNGVSFREYPSTQANILSKLSLGTEVKAVEIIGSWTLIEVDGVRGYVSSKYLDDKKELKVTTNSVNFRENPSATGNVIKKLAEGTEVYLIQTSGSWSLIEVDGVRGYVSSKYLDDKKTLKVITGSGVSFRKTASTGGELIGKLTLGTEVYVIESLGSWTLIEVDGVRGYVSSKYLDDKKELKVITNSVNFRENPSATGNVMKKLAEGTEVYLIQTSGSWSLIEVDGVRGYVSSKYLDNKRVFKYTNSLSLNFRDKPSASGTILDNIWYGEKVQFIEEIGSWSKVEYNGIVGYVSSNNLVDMLDISVKKEMEISVAISNVRQAPYESEKVIKELRYKQTVSFIEQIGSWAKVLYNGDIVYISMNNLRDITGDTPVEMPNETVQQLIELAKKQLGKQYVWGTIGPDTFDCSGFMIYLYKEITGIILPRESVDQYHSSMGTQIKLEKIEVGDLIFFDTEGNGIVNHVGMYIGNLEFIHASQKFEEVIISPIEGFYYDGLIGVKRIH